MKFTKEDQNCATNINGYDSEQLLIEDVNRHYFSMGKKVIKSWWILRFLKTSRKLKYLLKNEKWHRSRPSENLKLWREKQCIQLNMKTELFH